MSDLGALAKKISASPQVTILLHQQPDGDAIGSGVALALAIKDQAEVTIVSVDEPPKAFRDICGQIIFSAKLPEKADLIIAVDVGELYRTGFGKILSNPKNAGSIALIDHHATGDIAKIAQYSYCRSASATAELVFDLLSELRVEITPPIATALLLGLYTDTGGFQHQNTSSSLLKLAGRLVSYGGNLNLISRSLRNQTSQKQKRLWGYVLDKVTINRYGLANARLSLKELENYQAEYQDLAGLANYLSLISEDRAVCLTVEDKNGWRTILRTRHANINLSRLAKLFGGTGTKKIAGFTVTKDLFSSKISE
ncbi:MAG TPA: DHH family phosphoesterase [Candidatus Saccharimonadales bacterium]|nr:DHH family phosphoesterase [Candidatus Saccharimonadales bacterium]